MKIKILLTLLFMVGLGLTLKAQSVTFGPRVGVNFATQVTAGENDFEDYWNDNVKSSTGIQVGAVANIMFNEMFSVQPELLYVQKGYKFIDGDLTETGKFDYLELPVLAKISFGSAQLQGFITAGPTLGYWMSGKTIYKEDGNEFSETIDFDDSFDGTEKQFEAGGSIGVGLAARVGAGALNLDVRYGAGFTGTYDVDGKSKYKNNGISLSVAYLFGM